MSRVPLSQRLHPQIGLANGLRRMARGSATGQAAQASPARPRVQATVLPAPPPSGGGGTTIDWVTFNKTGFVVAAGTGTDNLSFTGAFLDYPGASAPAWAAITAGGHIELTETGLYQISAWAYASGDLTSEAISLDLNVDTSNGSSSYGYPNGNTPYGESIVRFIKVPGIAASYANSAAILTSRVLDGTGEIDVWCITRKESTASSHTLNYQVAINRLSSDVTLGYT